MKVFASLYARLDATTSSQAKLAAMVGYFADAPADDAAWAVYFLAGGKPRQLVPTRVLRDFALAQTRLPEWLFDECYQGVGDLAETIALLVGPIGGEPTNPAPQPLGLAGWLDERLLPLRGLAPPVVLARLAEDWRVLDQPTRFVHAKLITGALRVGVSKSLLTRALGSVAGIEPTRIAERLVGYTDLRNRPDALQYRGLMAPEGIDGDGIAGDGPVDRPREGPRGLQPYPFFLAQPLPPASSGGPYDRLGPPSGWLVEWKWDGVRAQLVRREGRMAVWSRGEELVTDRFPEFSALLPVVPDGTVIDGEIVADRAGIVQSFSALQKRLGRKQLSPRLLAELPVTLLAYDLLERDGADLRGWSQQARRSALEQVVGDSLVRDPAVAARLRLSPLVEAGEWADIDALRQSARSRGVEGMMLKCRQARYGVGRTREAGTWWKWKVDPFSVDAVLIYAQRGHGRRAGLYSDYTFAVWDRESDDLGAPVADGAGTRPPRRLVPFAKAYSGLTDAEMSEVDAIIRRTTLEKFGPVRSVAPSLVFELAFEGIARSGRHRSGVAVRFPRMLRWRRDKPVAEADTLPALAALLPP